MTVTVRKNNILKVDNELPNASEIKKLEKKDRVITVYIGKPQVPFDEMFGAEPRILINDKFDSIESFGSIMLEKINEKPEYLKPFITVSLKVDKNVSMGLISDVKKELRKINALKINYTTYNGDAFQNMLE